MSSLRAPDLLLFVAGEPELSPSVREVEAGMGDRLSSMFLGVAAPTIITRASAEAARPPESGFHRPPLTDSRRWHVPASQLMCESVVLEQAKRQGRIVLVVDANRPGDQQDLVDRWVRPNDALPLLVRSDGARLEGEENFTPGRVRRFLGRR